jgi:tetratricopeptide (TPR) repeat protein
MPPGLRASQEGMLRDSIRLAEIAEGHPLKRAEVSRYWSAKATDYIHSHPKEWSLLMLKKLRNIWNAYQYDDLSIITSLSEDGILLPGLRFGLVAALAIPGLVLAWRRYPLSKWVTAGVLLHMAALLPVFVTERYRLAAVPGLLLLGSAGLVILWESLAYRQWKTVAVYLGVAAVGTYFVSLPQEDQSLWSLDCYNSGLKALDNGDLLRAQEKLERAFAYVPENSDINFGLGNLWLAKHDKTKAKYFYRRAVELSSQNVGARNNLAVLAIAEKQWRLAKLLLTQALAVEPDDAKVHYLLAYTEYEEGDASAAKAEIAKAISLRPSQKEFQQLQTEMEAGGKLTPVTIAP